MIKSMTGFASVEVETPEVAVSVTLRSVNHRHLDLQLRLPSALLGLEPELRGLVQKRLTRGRVELGLTAQFSRRPEVEVELNEALVRALSDALERARAAGVAVTGLTAGDLLRLPHAVEVRERSGEADAVRNPEVVAAVSGAVTRAVESLDAMRREEGAHLRTDLDNRCAQTAEIVRQLEVRAEQGREGLESRLTARVGQLALDPAPDAALIAQEVVKFAARSDISEELARLKGHLAHWTVIADAEGACGRKLDFLLQEMNREVNTVGSKAEGLEIAVLVVSAKAELERLREQVQNVE